MRNIPASLSQKLAEGVTTIAEAWRVTRGDGVVAAFTQHDRDLSFAGTLFKAAGSLLGTSHEREVGLSPDRTALSGALDASAISENDLKLGRWNGAKIEAFWVDWTEPAAFIPMWRGQVAGANWRGNGFELDIVGQEASLSREIGRVYARTCDATLGDGRCKVDLGQNGRTFASTILAVTSDRSFTISIPAGKSAGHFVGGRFELTSGVANGWRSGIASIVAGPSDWTLTTSRPFALSPVAGNAVSISMGCDKSFVTCKDRFANALNFRGQPTLPGDDVAFGGPAASGNTGGKR
jgi:uncharacterized phage protein (TIGR02218 family)